MDACAERRNERDAGGGVAPAGARQGKLAAALGLALAVTLLLACGSDARLVVGEQVSLEGRITEIDPTPMFVDGDGVLVVTTHRGEVVTVLVPAREALCPARGLDVFHSLRPGDEIRAVGVAVASSAVRVCVEQTHLLERADSVAKSVTREAPRALRTYALTEG